MKKDNYKELKEKYLKKIWEIVEHSEFHHPSLNHALNCKTCECKETLNELLNFILKEVIPMAEKKGYKKGYNWSDKCWRENLKKPIYECDLMKTKSGKFKRGEVRTKRRT